jgi:hypothetical protein
VSFEPVNIYIEDDTIAGLPISGVVVAIYNAAGTTPITQGTSNGSGIAAFLLDAGASGVNYSVRLHKNGVVFANPRIIEVLPAPAVNDFDIIGAVYVPPVSADTRICIACGYFRTGAGKPAKYLDMHFIPKFDPLLVDGAAVLTERVSVRTDKNGYVEVPLFRYGQYDVLVEGREDLTVMISVPNQNNINLPDLPSGSSRELHTLWRCCSGRGGLAGPHSSGRLE